MSSSPQPPQLSDDARRAALVKAGVVRRERAELKNRLKTGSVGLADLFAQADSDDVIGKMKVLALLESLPGVGKVKARRTMETVGIAETRRVRGLGDQQRSALLAAFPHPPR
jgi:signal recognition particle GTPase